MYSSSSTSLASIPLPAKRTVNAPSTGQSSFGVNWSCLSFTQNQTPAIAGEMTTPEVTRFSTCDSGAADSLKSTFIDWMDVMPLSPYSVGPGAVTVYSTKWGTGLFLYQM